MRTLLLTILLLPSLVWGQQRTAPRITFDLIGVNEGLPHATVARFLEDDRGLLWVGMHQGLAVYDGSAFTPVDLVDNGGPIGVRNLALDENGIIWVAAEQGPVRVDPILRKAELITYPDSLKQGVETLWSHAVAATGPGEMLFGTHKGTYFLDAASRSFRSLRHADGEHVRTYWEDFLADSARHGVWISTHDRGLVFYDTSTKTLREKEDSASFSPLLGKNVMSLCPDGHGGLWCSDRTTGQLWNWDGRTDRIRTWDHVPGAPDAKISRAWTLARDKHGRVWGASGLSGGFMFSTVDSTAVLFPSDRAEAGDLPYGSVNDVYESVDGQIWIATLLGIAVYDPVRAQARFFQVPPLQGRRSIQQVWNMAFSGDSLLWCAMGEDGLALIDLQSGEVRNVNLSKGGEAPDYIWDVLSHGDDIFVAGANVLLRVDPRTMRVSDTKLQDEEGAPLTPGYRWLASDVSGAIWMGYAMMNAALIDPATGIARTHVPDTTKPGELRYDNLYGAVGMPDGRLWGIGNIRGLTYYDPRSDRWTDLYDDVKEHRFGVGRIVNIAASSDSVLWLATDGAGLVRYDIPTAAYTQYDHRHGITELGLISVGVDARGRIWANSEERMFCFEPETERAIVVDPRTSTGGDAARWSLAMSRSGLIAMNVGREIAVFNANMVGSDRIPPAPIMTRLLVDGAASALDPNGAIGARYDHAQIEVHFGAILPPGNIVAYAMRAPGEEWSEYKEGRVTLRGLRPGEHVFEFRLMNQAGRWGSTTALRVHIPPPWWQTYWARIAMGLLLAVAIVLVFRARLNWVRKRERAQEEQARQVNELKLQALRAQMDPHFVFNCLNSIDSFIIANDREQASHYLGRFAKLIRLILQHSDRTRVPLEREVEMLKYYLELETLRFKTPFTFELRVDELLEGEPVELPTMLVQPYIENAIWHGLRHKDSAGHLLVAFALADDILECVVEDNGIGREASRAINEQRSGVHRSMGMQVSADRLRLYGEMKQGASRVVIEDLKDADGRPCGTRATITIHIMDKETAE